MSSTTYTGDAGGRLRFLGAGPALPAVGIALLLAGYVFPLRIGQISDSLALGFRVKGYPLGLSNAGSLVMTVGTFALLLAALLISVPPSLRALPAGVVSAGGVLQGLLFVSILSAAPWRSPAPWLGLIGSAVLAVAGARSIIRLTRSAESHRSLG